MCSEIMQTRGDIKKVGLSSAIVPRESKEREKHGIFHVFRGGPRFFGSLCPGSNPGGVVNEKPQP